MKNHDNFAMPDWGYGITFSFSKVFFSLLLILAFNSAPFTGTAQDFCHTDIVTNGNGKWPSNAEKSASTPCQLRIYIHVLRRSNGTGGQTVTDVWEALSYLDAAFNPHGIFFEWSGCIDYIDFSEIYDSDARADLDALWTINGHGDGIDIYLAQDDHIISGGRADRLGSRSLWVAGSFTEPVAISAVKSYVLAHEMGHLFDLEHTHWSCNEVDNWENTDGSNCEEKGDFVCDTPADPSLRDHVNADCEWDHIFCINEPILGGEECGDCRVGNYPPEPENAYNPDTKNIMSYTIPSCMEYFTQG